MEDLNALIINRLGEHQRKVDFIKRNLRYNKDSFVIFKKTGLGILSIAACIAIIFAVSTYLYESDSLSNISLTPPSFEEYRGVNTYKIVTLINEEKFEQAFKAIDNKLVEIDNEIDSISSMDIETAEQAYMLALCNGEKEELMWSKIYLLVKMNRKDDILNACENYLNINNYNEHAKEVKMILGKIQ